MRRSDPSGPGIHRIPVGRTGTFRYEADRGSEVVDDSTLDRIQELAIPPAWTDVWICDDALGHIQAVGRDAAERLQYLYHEEWRRRRDEAKFDRALELAAALPHARRSVTRDLSRDGFEPRRALAAAFRIMDFTAVRVGNEEYLRRYGSRGVTTMRCRDLVIESSSVIFEFPSKGGLRWSSSLNDPLLTRYFREIVDQRGPSARAVAWRDSKWHAVTTAEVNDYVHRRTGTEATAKDFRTLRGTTTAAEFLARAGTPATSKDAESTIRSAIKACADLLGNTPAVARTSYIDPRIFDLYRSGEVLSLRGSSLSSLCSLLAPQA
ncbi:DNA topoisomerase IB [Humibacter sp. RRB41]|uniref:DNA topoisomerase IB n=1 Tax=Humibacter sp. RRB41 TaxID=2919946 RepID=UPI001FAAE35C|nr:DNA topoisomerase IB [Humibacter sp. RRB41]